MDIERVLKEFKQRIAKLYGQRLKKVVLYGSYARGLANGEHSDIDLAVVLAGGRLIPAKKLNEWLKSDLSDDRC